jgi:AcrR family transcriptional regulator
MPPAARRDAARARETDLRTAVLDAARQLLVREGYRDLSMRDVATAVGCSVSSIYLYFAGKDELVHTLMDEGFDRWYRKQRELADEGGTPLSRLEAGVPRLRGVRARQPRVLRDHVHVPLGPHGAVPEGPVPPRAPNLELIAELVRAYAPEAVPTPTTRASAPPHSGRRCTGIVSTIISDRLDRGIDRTRYVEGTIRYALAGVRHAEPEGSR